MSNVLKRAGEKVLDVVSAVAEALTSEPDLPTARAALAAAVVERNRLLSVEAAARERVRAAKKQVESLGRVEDRAALAAAQAALADAEDKTTEAMAVYDEAVDVLREIENRPPPLPNMPAESEPLDPAERLVLVLDGGVREDGDLHRTAPTSRYGTTRQIREMLGWRIPDVLTPGEIEKLRSLQADSVRIFRALNEAAHRRPSDVQSEHSAQLAVQIRSGTAAKDLPDAFNVADFTAEREALLSAHKTALKQITVEAFAIGRPLLRAAAAVCREWLLEECRVELARYEDFGIPHPGPSEILRSIRATCAFLAIRAETPPVFWSHPQTVVCDLIDLSIQPTEP